MKIYGMQLKYNFVGNTEAYILYPTKRRKA